MEKNDRMIGEVYDLGDELLKTVTGEMKVCTIFCYSKFFVFLLESCFQTFKMRNLTSFSLLSILI